MASPIKPAEFGGIGRQPGPFGGLKDAEFPSRCAPAIQPRTRIIGVCGTNDFCGAASPSFDGWFLSDFYLFHHLFKGTGSNQIWLTCLDPQMLVDKYVEYAHGNRLGDRRIVLDSILLPDILAAGNMRVVPPSLLLDRSLATIRSECRIAKDLDQPVLILIFGHGDQYTGGVSIGGQKTSDTPRLTIASMKQAIGKGVDVAILMTSCYSGCWIVNPQLNVSAMTAAGPEKMSESWAQSQSSSRATGSIYAFAVLQALIKMEEPTMTQEHGSTTCVDMDDLISSSTYGELSRVICRTLLDDVDTMGEDHDIKFSTQNDWWETEWRQRSGIPLGPYKERWEMLRNVPVDTADPCTNRCPRAQDNETSPSQASAKFSYGLRGSSSVRGLRGVVQSMAENYMLSFPGRDSFAPNVYHYTFRNMVLGKVVVDDDQLVELFDILHYRLSGMRLASEYASVLSLPLPDCFAHDTDAWIQDISLAGRQHDPAGQAAREKRNHYKAIHSLVYDARIFDAALRDQGWGYSKPCDYLSVGLAKSGMTMEEAELAIKKLQALKVATVTHLTTKVRRNLTARSLASKIFEKCRALGDKLHVHSHS